MLRLPRRALAVVCPIVLISVFTLRGSVVSGDTPPPFSLDHGNAGIEVVIPRVIPVIFQTVSPNASDATIVLRITALITNAWFDAIAPYHPTAVGVYSRLGRLPTPSGTDRERNIAMIYASYRVLNSVLPQRAADWRAMVASAGLDPDFAGHDATPAGVGNRAGAAVAAAREQDGMNQLGDAGGRQYNRQPYADYLGYEPVNTAYELRDPSRWQPDIVTMGNGLFRVQQFVTPQLRVTRPYSYQTPNRFHAPVPHDSNPRGSRGRQAYQQQADEVLAASAALTDYQKMAAELFDNKLNSLGFSALFVTLSRSLTLEQFVHYDFLTNMAAFDTGIVVWNEKHRYDAVRPFSAIRYLYGRRPVLAWGGPGVGTVQIPGDQWRSYLSTADHPEYPSGSASFCAAHAQASRRYLGSDDLGWFVEAPAGSSRVEPGVTPAADIVLGPWHTWTDFEQECGTSRLWGGVHFRGAIEAGWDLGREIGDVAFEFVSRHIHGTAE